MGISENKTAMSTALMDHELKTRGFAAGGLRHLLSLLP
jgi:hypothetical protein